MRRRLTFLPALVDRPTLEASPYTYCAVTNNLALCCLLHARNVLPQQPVVVAAFSAGGWAGVTPWQKRISVSSAETALMAGARGFLCTSSMGSRHWASSLYVCLEQLRTVLNASSEILC